MEHQQALDVTTHSRSNQTQGDDARKVIEWCNILLVSSRAIALSLDPLFFFVPVIHEDKKCISEDKKMWINAIFWRSVLDFIYLVLFFVVKFYNASNATIAERQRYPWMRFMLDILVILPIPQVLMSSILSEMRRAKNTNNVTILTAVMLSQSGARVLQVYLYLKKSRKYKIIAIEIKASYSLFLYLLAGHGFGAFWYFFSIQRLTYCWSEACLLHGECVQGSFNCDHSFGNLSVLHDFCSIDSTNTSAFDFGIFLEARRSGILESTDFPKKLIYTAWWGFRNLSSFGSNLHTSTYVWENAFAFGISMFGLFLLNVLICLFGNLQQKRYPELNLQTELGQDYKQRRASESIKESEKESEDKKPALDVADVKNLLTELVQLYKQRSASKSIEKSENDRKLELDDAVIEILLK